MSRVEAFEYCSIVDVPFFQVAAQNFEYKMSNILDKPLESVCLSWHSLSVWLL